MLTRLYRQYLRRNPKQEVGRRLYAAVLTYAMQPRHYAGGPVAGAAVADDFDGRFDMTTAIAATVIARIHGMSGDPYLADDLRQGLLDAMFDNMKVALREIGVGDLRVSKHLKRMVEAFHGRLARYREALETGDEAALAAALEANLFRKTEAEAKAPAAAAMAKEMLALYARLSDREDALLADGAIEDAMVLAGTTASASATG